MKALLRNRHLQSLSGNGAMAVLSVFTYSILFRFLSEAAMGNWVFFQFAFLLLDTFRTGLLQTPLIKFYAGADAERQRAVAGAAWHIGLLVTGVFVVLNLVALPLAGLIPDVGLRGLLPWFGLTLVATLPFNVAVWMLQAEERFDRILWVRLLSQGSFIVVIFGLYLVHSVTLTHVIEAFVGSSALASVVTTLAGWGQLVAWRHRTAATVREVFHFGKYSFGTYLCSNLLRSSDVFVIRFMLGPAALAIYNLPQRLLEIIEMPLRSGLATAMPSMSAAVNQERPALVAELLRRYVGVLTVLFLVLVVGVLVFADVIVGLIGGGKYVGTEAAGVYRILITCSLLFPLERFLGVTLDIIGRPQINLIKVILALVVNVATDILCIRLTHNIYGAAWASVFTLVASTLYGYFMLRRYLPISLQQMPEQTYHEARGQLGDLLRRLRPARP